MNEKEFNDKITLIKQRANRYYENALKPLPIIEVNNYCIMISAKTGIDYDTVRYLVRETIRRKTA
jgi:hypothetical protein